jgi:hypothetical protein
MDLHAEAYAAATHKAPVETAHKALKTAVVLRYRYFFAMAKL